jgi:protein-tyrosine phosphatase
MLKRIDICLLVLGALPALAANVPGIKNFDQVDAYVFRGAQPTNEGFQYLAGIGVKTVIDLREAGNRSKEEERIVAKAGMAYLNVPMTGFGRPTESELLKILPILESAPGGPVFVHCRRGADRTGAVIAVYHIEHDHWNNARALKDAKAHGMSIFQIQRKDFVKNFRSQATASKNPAEARADATTVRATPAAARQ